MSSPHSPRRRPGGRCRPLSIEPLENRVYLSAQPVVAAPVSTRRRPARCWPLRRQLQNATAAVKTLTSGAFSQAAESINDFALDLYQYYQQQPGNLFLSPMSIATALAMTYAGAEGQTAAQMADVLHLGQSSTVAASFQALLNMLNSIRPPIGRFANRRRLVAGTGISFPPRLSPTDPVGLRRRRSKPQLRRRRSGPADHQCLGRRSDQW